MQVVTRYVMYAYGQVAITVRVSWPASTSTNQSGLVTLKVVSASSVTWALYVYLCLPVPLCSRVRPAGRVYATDKDRYVRQNHRLMPPPIRGGHNNKPNRKDTNAHRLGLCGEKLLDSNSSSWSLSSQARLA